VSNCNHLKFKTVSKFENLYRCRKCLELFTDFVLIKNVPLKEIEWTSYKYTLSLKEIEVIPVKSKNLLVRFWEFIKQCFFSYYYFK